MAARKVEGDARQRGLRQRPQQRPQRMRAQQAHATVHVHLLEPRVSRQKGGPDGVVGVTDPVVGLLSIGSEPGKGDRLRSSTDDLLAGSLPAAGVRYAGPVEGHDLALGERAQVVVTDGFTGNVLLKGLEGAVRWSAHRMGVAYGDPAPARRVVQQTATSDFAGGMLLGVQGVTVIGHGAGTPEQVAACVRLAARASGTGLVQATRTALAKVVRA